MIFFTIPWIFVIAVIVMVLGMGTSVLQFVLDHIIIISIIVWLPVALWVISGWSDKNLPDEEKVERALFPLFQFPAYIGIIKIVVSILDLLGHDLFGFFIYLLMGPVILLLPIVVCLGIAQGLTWLYKKVIKSKFVTLAIGIVAAVSITYFFWQLDWL